MLFPALLAYMLNMTNNIVDGNHIRLRYKPWHISNANQSMLSNNPLNLIIC
ncbi:hypothetical protein D3C80_2017370 [compost metagenome]